MNRLLVLLCCVAGLLAGAPAALAASTYIVQLKAPPLAGYRGGTRGIPATKVKRMGEKLNVRSAAAQEYRSYLAGRQDAALGHVSGAAPKIDYAYRVAFSGFAAELTGAQARQLGKAPEVARVFKDALAHPDATAEDTALGGFHGDGASYLGLTPNGRLWDQLGGVNSVTGAGAGVVVGVLDTGITPQHPSFSANPPVGPNFPAPVGWHGTCQTGEAFLVTDCNNKLIGARWFVNGFGAADTDPTGFLSARDDDGHGTHTTSTAAGDFGVSPLIDGRDPTGGKVISGISPRSQVAMYKVCWVGRVGVPSGCTDSDSLAAIDAAVTDGVDVINYSIGSPVSNVVDPVEIAFLNAVAAGVFVATAAGNDGPGVGTVGSPASIPWLTTVGAATLARGFEGTATISGVGLVHGASVTAALPSVAIVDAEASALSTATAANAALCKPGTLDLTKVAGKIVLCKRGVNARLDKSRNVLAATGAGMILYNAVHNQDVETDNHFVPTLHVDDVTGGLIKAKIPGATVSAPKGPGIAVTPIAPFDNGHVLAAFSSRGPQTAVPDIPKPDVTAPGVQILAGAAPVVADQADGSRSGNLFQAIAGTSMSSPHVAGAGALLKQRHPTWSPSAIKSALMETANPDVLLEDGTTPANPFQQGSGEIDPSKATDAGLVVDATPDDYVAYLRAVAPDAVLTAGPVTQPTDLNLAAISNSAMAGTLSTKRTFTSVDATPQTWNVTFDGLTGISHVASLAPSFTIDPGASKTIDLAFMRTTAPLNEYVFGALVLTNGARTVRLPISLQPIALSVPKTIKVDTAADAGTQAVPIQSGITGQVSGLGFGLFAPIIHAGETIVTTTQTPDNTPGTKVYPVTVPNGAQLLSGRTSNVDGGDPNTDIDLFLFKDSNGNGILDVATDEFVDQSAGSTALETINVTDPTPGDYLFAVVGFQTKTPPPTTYDFSTWTVADPTPDDATPAPGISLTGDPLLVNIGQQASLNLNWAGVTKKGLYLGVVNYTNDQTADKATSIVELNETADKAATPPAGGGGTPTPPKIVPKLKISLLSMSARGRILTVRLKLTITAKLSATVRRAGRLVASAKARTVFGGRTRTVRMRLNHRLKRGKTYTVRLRAVQGKLIVTRSKSLRVSRR